MSRLTRGRMLALPVRDYHPLRFRFPDGFWLSRIRHWPGPRSLATTCGVSVDVLSCRYLDVSVPCVRFLHPILFRCRYLVTMLRNLKCFTGHQSVEPTPHQRRWPLALPSPNGLRSLFPARPYKGRSKSQDLVSQQFRFSKHLRWVAPFGDPWIKAYSQLPTAFRSVSRPSSPVHA